MRATGFGGARRRQTGPVHVKRRTVDRVPQLSLPPVSSPVAEPAARPGLPALTEVAEEESPKRERRAAMAVVSANAPSKRLQTPLEEAEEESDSDSSDREGRDTDTNDDDFSLGEAAGSSVTEADLRAVMEEHGISLEEVLRGGHELIRRRASVVELEALHAPRLQSLDAILADVGLKEGEDGALVDLRREASEDEEEENDDEDGIFGSSSSPSRRKGRHDFSYLQLHNFWDEHAEEAEEDNSVAAQVARKYGKKNMNTHIKDYYQSTMIPDYVVGPPDHEPQPPQPKPKPHKILSPVKLTKLARRSKRRMFLPTDSPIVGLSGEARVELLGHVRQQDDFDPLSPINARPKTIMMPRPPSVYMAEDDEEGRAMLAPSADRVPHGAESLGALGQPARRRRGRRDNQAQRELVRWARAQRRKAPPDEVYFGSDAAENFFKKVRTQELHNKGGHVPVDTAQLSPREAAVVHERQLWTQLTARSKLIEELRSQGRVPEPCFIRDRDNPNFEFSYRSLGDGYGLALAKAMPLLEGARVLDLRHNRLTDKSLEPLFTNLGGGHPLELIDISNNRAGLPTVTALSEFLLLVPRLQSIKLSGCHLSDASAVVLCEALGSGGVSSAHELDLSHNNLQTTALGELIEVSTHLTTMDLSWNRLKGAAASRIGRALIHNRTLRKLNMSYNACGPAAISIGVALVYNSVLRELNVGYNNIKTRGADMIAYGLRHNQGTVEMVVLDGNPIGSGGHRSIAQATNVRVSVEGCSTDEQQIPFERVQFDKASPGGDYVLHLEKDWDFAVASQLIELATHTEGCRLKSLAYTPPGGPRAEIFLSLSMVTNAQTGEQFQTLVDPAVSARTRWRIPNEGRLDLKFQFERLGHQATGSAVEDTDIDALHVAIEKELQHASASTRIKLTCVKDTFLLSTQVTKLVNRFKLSTHKVRVLASLVSQVVDHETCQDLFKRLLSDRERALLEKSLGQAFYLDTRNATGHYAIDFAVPTDVDMGLRLLEMSNTQNRARQLAGLEDTSQHANWSSFRCEQIGGDPVSISNTFFDHRPQSGILEFDFVGLNRPPRDATACSARVLRDLVQHARFDELPPELPTMGDGGSSVASAAAESAAAAAAAIISGDDGEFEAEEEMATTLTVMRRFRRLANDHYFTCAQVARIVQAVPTTHPVFRLDLVVALFSLVLDLENWFVTIVKHFDDPGQRHLYRRLGPLNMCNPLQPEGTYTMDLSVPDQRQWAAVMHALAEEEPGEPLTLWGWKGPTWTFMNREAPEPADDGGATSPGHRGRRSSAMMRSRRTSVTRGPMRRGKGGLKGTAGALASAALAAAAVASFSSSAHGAESGADEEEEDEFVLYYGEAPPQAWFKLPKQGTVRFKYDSRVAGHEVLEYVRRTLVDHVLLEVD